MVNLLPVSRSFSFIVISVGGIVLSIVIAFLFISYNPTGFNFSINGYFIGISQLKEPSLDPINGNRREVSNKLPEISEGHDIVNDEQFNFGAEVANSNSSLSVNDIKDVSASTNFIHESKKNGSEIGGFIGAQIPAFAPELPFDANSSISVNGHENKVPDISLSSVFINGSGKNDSEVVRAAVPAVGPDLSVDSNSSIFVHDHDVKELNVSVSPVFIDDSGKYSTKTDGYIGSQMPAFDPTLSVDASSYVYVNVNDSKQPNVSVSSVFVDDSRKNDSGLGSTADSLHQTGSVAAPSPSKILKSKLRNCDLYHGKWVYDPDGPLYTNSTCPILAQPQNCQGNGRTNKNYENWRWRPNKCKIPRFDGRKFLELMRGKILAFVGDSLARNQMESLLCILWQTEVPINHGNRQMHKWYFRSTSTTIIRIWSAWLVQKTPLSIPSSSPRSVNVHVDSPDQSFMKFLPEFDILVLSSGHWFSTETTYLLNNTIIGGQLSPSKKIRKKKDIIRFYDLALQTTLNAILEVPTFKGLIILRSYSPEHYTGGGWNSGGGCTGIDKPAIKSVRSGYTNSMEKVQVVEFETAAKKLRNGVKLRFMDVTEMSGYRNDGHAGKYSRKVMKKNAAEDCVHWCMPGVVDTWNEVLFEMLKREF